MTEAEMRDWFDILQDKNNAPYFTNPEKDEFIMDANWDYINEYIGDYENPSVMGRDKAAVNALRTLIMDTTALTPIAGLITELAVNNDLSETIIIPLAIVVTGAKAAKFLNHSDIHKAENNIYKKGQALQPNYTIASEGYQMYPVSIVADTVVTALVEPTTIDALPASIHHKIIAKAMTKTGLVTENQAITMMEQPTNG
jgi:hypothetical protein